MKNEGGVKRMKEEEQSGSHGEGSISISGNTNAADCIMMAMVVAVMCPL